jgi:hypothetical protein
METRQESKYKEYWGKITHQIPLALLEERIPPSINQILQKRIEIIDSEDNKAISKLWNEDIYSRDALIYHPSNKVKLVLDTPLIYNITPRTKLINGALVLNNEEYDNLEGTEFTLAQLSKYTKIKTSNKCEIKNNPIWKILSRDQILLEEYVEQVFKLAKSDYEYLMGTYINNPIGVVTGNLWYISGINNQSIAIARSNLNYDKNYFFGILPDIQKLSKPTYKLDSIKKNTMNKIEQN